jgi:hypothetical protein
MVKPEKSYRYGAINVAVFENEVISGGKTIKLKKVSFQKRYKDSDGEWKNTNSLDVNDIPKAILALSRVYESLVLSDRTAENTDSLKSK